MNRADIASRTKEIIADQLAVDAGRISETSSFIDDLGADSVDLVKLIMALEEEFNIQTVDNEAEAVRTVGEAIDLIITKTG